MKPHCPDATCVDPACGRLPEVIEWLGDYLADLARGARAPDAFVAIVERRADALLDAIPENLNSRVVLAALALALRSVATSVRDEGVLRVQALAAAQPD